MNRSADGGSREYAKEGRVSAANAIVFIYSGHRADHSLQQLIGKSAFAPRFFNAARHCSKATLDFPDSAGRDQGTNDQDGDIPHSYRAGCILLDAFAAVENFVLFL